MIFHYNPWSFEGIKILKLYLNVWGMIDLIDAAYEDLNTARMDLGAFQKNSLENTLSSVKTENENLSKSISTIADTDAASEVASMAKNKILLQTSQSMLAQANQKPRHVLTLIEDS